MSKRSGVKSDDAENDDHGFLSRWSARKTQIVRGESVPEDSLEEQNEADGTRANRENDEEATLSDNELLEKYELPDPNDINEEAGLDRFFDGKTPERLRQMALRRLWRINPFFGIVDDMVEYGEDYTDAATVIDGMQTAYQAGKGYLKKAIESGEDDEGVESPTSQLDRDSQADEELNADDEGQKSEIENQIDTGVENREGSGEEAEREAAITSSEDNPSLERSASEQSPLVDENRDEVSHAESSMVDEEKKSASKPTEKSATPMKPKRMQFRLDS
jgi:hypothetical protein